MKKNEHIAIIGGGYTGMIAAYELSKAGKKVTIFEKEDDLGGLARSFDIGNGIQLERFYHHWFKSDKHIMSLIEEMALTSNIVWNKTNTGMYFANNFYKLSSPIELLKFSALSFTDRIKLGLLTLKAKYVKDWKELESLSAKDWLIKNAGKKVYEVVWEPLLKGKFGDYSDSISAVWIWNKLKLRGSSRNKKGGESLAYYRGGFAALTSSLKESLRENGVKIETNSAVHTLIVKQNKVVGVGTSDGKDILCDSVLSTVALPILSKIINKSKFGSDLYIEYFKSQISSIKYLGNVCLVLVLEKSLSDTYWMNVNDPDFPFVAVIEHTNFEPRTSYEGKYIVYLSKYLPVSDLIFGMTKKELLNFSIPYIKRMFPKFNEQWIQDAYLWKESYSQPIVTKNYSQNIPSFKSPISGLFLSCMAQIYPEDRGTNYAVKYGKIVSEILINNNTE